MSLTSLFSPPNIFNVFDSRVKALFEFPLATFASFTAFACSVIFTGIRTKHLQFLVSSQAYFCFNARKQHSHI